MKPSKDQNRDLSPKPVIPAGEILGQLAAPAAPGDFFSSFGGMQILFGPNYLIWPKKSVFGGIGDWLWGLFQKEVIQLVLSGLRECQGFPLNVLKSFEWIYCDAMGRLSLP